MNVLINAIVALIDKRVYGQAVSGCSLNFAKTPTMAAMVKKENKDDSSCDFHDQRLSLNFFFFLSLSVLGIVSDLLKSLFSCSVEGYAVYPNLLAGHKEGVGIGSSNSKEWRGLRLVSKGCS